MKTLRALFLLLILFVNGVAFYVYYAVQLHRIHHAMRSRVRSLPDDQLDTIVLSAQEFDELNIEAEQELKWHGNMYDIARVEKHGEVYTVYCLRDRAEENLLALAQSLLTKPIDQDDFPGEIFDFLSMEFIGQQHAILFPMQVGIKSSSTYWFSSKTNHLCIDQPPPETIML